MKRLSICCLLLGLVGFSGSVLALKGEILMTAKRDGGDIVLVFEALNDGGVVALQYEVNLKGIAPQQVDLSGCVGTFKSSQLAGCHLNDDGSLRVGIINEGLRELSTGEVGRITLRGLKALPASVSVGNAAIVDQTGNERQVKALVDFGGLKESAKPQPGERLQRVE